MINLQKKKPSFEEMSIKELQEQLVIIEEAKAKKENILSIQATNDKIMSKINQFFSED